MQKKKLNDSQLYSELKSSSSSITCMKSQKQVATRREVALPSELRLTVMFFTFECLDLKCRFVILVVSVVSIDWSLSSCIRGEILFGTWPNWERF